MPVDALIPSNGTWFKFFDNAGLAVNSPSATTSRFISREHSRRHAHCYGMLQVHAIDAIIPALLMAGAFAGCFALLWLDGRI
jgi:hypothetical protein